jgi:hypothetical protein
LWLVSQTKGMDLHLRYVPVAGWDWYPIVKCLARATPRLTDLTGDLCARVEVRGNLRLTRPSFLPRWLSAGFQHKLKPVCYGSSEAK